MSNVREKKRLPRCAYQEGSTGLFHYKDFLFGMIGPCLNENLFNEHGAIPALIYYLIQEDLYSGKNKSMTVYEPLVFTIPQLVKKMKLPDTADNSFMIKGAINLLLEKQWIKFVSQNNKSRPIKYTVRLI